VSVVRTLATSVLAATLLLSAGCGGAETARLQSIADRLKAQRDQKASAAEHLLELRRNEKELEARVYALGLDDSAGKERFAPALMIAAQALSSGVTVAILGSAGVVTISGTKGAPEALRALGLVAADVPAAGIRHFELRGKAWSATIARIDSAPPSPASAAASASPTPLVLPPKTYFSGHKSAELRARIEALQRENEMLDAISGESVALTARREALLEKVRSLGRADRAMNAETVLTLLFSSDAPIASAGSADFEADRSIVRATVAPDAPVDLAIAALSKTYEVTRKPSAPDALQLELARRSNDAL
jgi:hypothetical protein